MFSVDSVIVYLAWFVGGAFAGRGVQRLVDALRVFTPSPAYSHATARRLAWLPVCHWLVRRHDVRASTGRWLGRPMLELALGLTWAGLWHWEIVRHALSPWPVAEGLQAASFGTYLAHLLLVTLMLAAALIDWDETQIPDEITVPGTLLGLAWAACWPQSLLPVPAFRDGGRAIDFLKLSSPHAWPMLLDGAPHAESLAMALALFAIWCFALLPRQWRGRRGPRVALTLIARRIRRERFTRVLLGLWIVGSLAIALVWNRGGVSWQALLSSLSGMAVAGGMIWAVRLIGQAVLGREAMGFGDVTLMAMIGSFVGWQPSLFIFFLAPFCGLAIGGIGWVMHRESQIPYGPYLCLATLAVIVAWQSIWLWALDRQIFAVWFLLPLVMAVGMVLLAILLGLVRLVGYRR